MSREPLVLAIDYGTQSVRSILFDKAGNTIGKAKININPYFSQKPGWAEQHADYLWEKLCESSLTLKAQCSTEWDRIKAVSITTGRDNCICLDKDNNPLRPFILWLDLRKCSKVDPTGAPMRKSAIKIAGMYEVVKMQRAQSHVNWIVENEPEIWAKTDKYVLMSTYMTYKLTGSLTDSVASQIGHIPFNYKAKRYYKPYENNACVFDMTTDKLIPESNIKEPGEKLGSISKKASKETGIPEGLPLIASGSDKGCETLGVGCANRDIAALSFGTTATIQFSTTKYVEPVTFMPAYPAVKHGCFNPEVMIWRGYWMITWFKREFAHKEVKEAQELGVSPEELLNQHLSEINPGCDGLILQPYWSPGMKNPEAKGAVIGFADYHTRAHLYRAIIEGIGFGLYDGMKTMEKRIGTKIKTIRVSGGGSQCDAICQITADMFGLPVQRVQTYETSGLGAAIAGFTGVGEFENFDEAVKSMVHIKDEFTPDHENHKIYKRLYERIYKRMYKKLKEFYIEIKNITKIN